MLISVKELACCMREPMHMCPHVLTGCSSLERCQPEHEMQPLTRTCVLAAQHMAAAFVLLRREVWNNLATTNNCQTRRLSSTPPQLSPHAGHDDSTRRKYSKEQHFLPHTWKIWLRRPRMCAGAISLLYSVTATEANATAMPSRIRPTMSIARLNAVQVITTPTSKNRPAMSIVFLRPYFLMHQKTRLSLAGAVNACCRGP